MTNIIIKQAQKSDIPVLENILLDTVNWLNEMGQPLWGVNEVSWDMLSRKYKVDDFYIAYSNSKPSGCMAVVDYDPSRNNKKSRRGSGGMILSGVEKWL